MTWDALRQSCLACSRCPLAGTRHHVVFGVGPEDAEVLFVGEGPGQQEDLQGGGAAAYREDEDVEFEAGEVEEDEVLSVTLDGEG